VIIKFSGKVFNMKLIHYVLLANVLLNPKLTLAIEICPYEIESKKADDLIASSKANIKALIEQLEKSDEKCSLKLKVQAQEKIVKEAIDALSENKFPDEKDMGDALKMGDDSFKCSASNKSLYSFVSHYVEYQAGNISFGLEREEPMISGELASHIENAINECADDASNFTGNILGKNKINICVYDKLKFNPTQESNPSSIVDTIYRKKCIGDDKEVFTEKFEKKSKDLIEKKTNFEKNLKLISEASEKISNMLADSTSEKPVCAGLKELTLPLVQDAMNTAVRLAGPWGMLAAPSIAPLVTLGVDMIGKHPSLVKKMNKALKELDGKNTEFRDRFSCNIFQANKLKCEMFNKQSALKNQNEMINKKNSTADNANDESCLPHEEGLSDIIALAHDPSLVKTEKDILTKSQAVEFYKKVWLDKVNPDSKTSFYDFLFDPKEGVFTRIINKKYTDPIGKDLAKDIKDLKMNLDKFKDEYDNYNSNDGSSFPSGAIAMRGIQSGSYIHALYEYLEDDVKEYQANDPRAVLKKDLKAQLINQEMYSFSKATRYDDDEEADLARKLDTVYKVYLKDDYSIRKKFILNPTLKELEVHAIELVKTAKFEANLKDPEFQFNEHIYPMFRDCMLNYQASMELKKDGKYEMNPDFKKYCSIFKGCFNKSNTIGLPFALEETTLGPDATNAKDFKACAIVNDYEVIKNRLKYEFLNKDTICNLTNESLIERFSEKKAK